MVWLVNANVLCAIANASSKGRPSCSRQRMSSGMATTGCVVVELYRAQVAKVRKVVAVLLFVALDYVLDGRADEDVLLTQTKRLAFHALVVGIEDVRDYLRGVLLRKRVGVVHIVELDVVQLVYGFALPEAQSVDSLSAVADDREVIRHGLDLHVRERHDLREIVSADGPGVAAGRPVVHGLHLEAVDESLLEQTVFISDAVTVERDILRRRRFEIAGGKASQTAVTESGVRYLLERTDVHSALFEEFIHFFKLAEVKQIRKDRTSHEILGAHVISALFLGLAFVRLQPKRIDVAHHGFRERIVKLTSRSFFHRGGIIVRQQLLHCIDDLIVHLRCPFPWIDLFFLYSLI